MGEPRDLTVDEWWRSRNSERLTPEEADHLLTVYRLAVGVLAAAGLGPSDEPDGALDKLRRIAGSA